MGAKNSTRYWKIQGWDSFTMLFEHRVKVGQFTENKMKDVLRTLTAKLALNEEEIISCYAKKGTKIYSDYLVVENLNGNNSEPERWYRLSKDSNGLGYEILPLVSFYCS